MSSSFSTTKTPDFSSSPQNWLEDGNFMTILVIILIVLVLICCIQTIVKQHRERNNRNNNDNANRTPINRVNINANEQNTTISIPEAAPIHSPALNSPVKENIKAPAFSELIPPPSPPPTYKTPMKAEEGEGLKRSKSYGGRTSSSFKDRITSLFSKN